MITLFRRIREKLIASGSITKYLLYAIGEILLVVIGILIALQVNNWNEARVQANQQEQIIQSLHNEFSDNLDELNYDLGRIDSILTASKKVLVMINRADKPDEAELDLLIGSTLGNPTWNPSSYVLNDLKNSGQISRLTDLDLQRRLFAWERHYENTLELSEFADESTLEYINYIKEEGSLRNIDAYKSSFDLEPSLLGHSNLRLLKDVRFENYLDDKYVTNFQLKEDYTKIVGIIENLLEATEN